MGAGLKRSRSRKYVATCGLEAVIVLDREEGHEPFDARPRVAAGLVLDGLQCVLRQLQFVLPVWLQPQHSLSFATTDGLGTHGLRESLRNWGTSEGLVRQLPWEDEKRVHEVLLIVLPCCAVGSARRNLCSFSSG